MQRHTAYDISPAMSSPEPTSNMTKVTTTEQGKAGKRKGTRSVSTLTPSQLARKRANDREAQRAIRARTKEHIENLEREIEELRGRHSHDQTVQDLLRRNKALEDELHRIKEIVGMHSGHPSAAYQTAYHSPSSRGSSFGQNTPDYPGFHDISPYHNVPDATEPWASTMPCSVPSTVSSPSSSSAPEEFGNAYFPTSAPSGVMDKASMPPSMSSPAMSCVNGDTGFEDVKSASSRIRMPSCQHRSPHANLPASALERIPRILPGIPHGAISQQNIPSWDSPVLITQPSCQNDALLVGYIQDCRRLVSMSGGHAHREVILGPARPDVKALLEAHPDLVASLGLRPSHVPHQSPHPMVDLAVTLFDGDCLNLPLERVGGFLLLRGILAWLIQPSRDHYLQLGNIFAPQHTQLTVPHPQWVDLLIWPRLRDVAIERPELYATRELRRLYSTNVRIQNWTGGVSRALSVDHATGTIHATDAFVEHVWRLENWALDSNFSRRYPELGGLVTLDNTDT
ncbi:hypothetical protein F4778DRAFT_513958 [Xylariomycetidae sp. FL2044]|nr:hypothetical protein F4778DRAFT_513958 [Xylariomycetidae sp. FL2044]